MKNKSSRHKETNAFKFQKFSERISNLEINVFHKIGHENELQVEEFECRFYEILQKWNTLNLSEGFFQFKKHVNAQCLITLPQLIHNKENVVGILIQYLNMKNTMFLQPLLELTAALVEDLRNEFYPYFLRFLNILIDLLHLNDADVVESVFTCLAYMFKFLWKFLSRDMTIVLNSVLPLLSNDKPEYIVDFACESFSFVARKVRDLQAFLKLILETVLSRKDTLIGCSKLIFEIIHGSAGHFHSCAELWLPFMFRSLACNKYPQAVLFEITQHVVANILLHILPEKSDLFWNTSYTVLNEFYDDLSSNSQQINFACGYLLKIIHQAVEFRNGIFLKNPQKIVNQLVQFFNMQDLNEPLLQIIVDLCSAILVAKKIDLSQEQTSQMITNVQSLKLRNVYLRFVDSLIDYAGFDLLIFPNFVKFCVNAGELEIDSLNTLTKIILKKSPFCNNGILLNAWKRYPINFSCEQDKSFVLKNMLHKLNDMENEANNYLSAVICLPHLNMKSSEIEKKLVENCELLLQLLHSQEKEITPENKKRYLFLLMCTVQCMVHLNVHYMLNYEKVVETLLPFCSDVFLIESLQVLSLYLSKLKDDKKYLRYEMLMKINKYLEDNFISPFHEVRLLTTYIYSLFEDLPYFTEISTDFKEDWKLFSICFKIESTEFQIHTFNDQLQCIEKLSFQSIQIQICNLTPFKLVPLKYLCGLLYVNFQLLWNSLSKIISTYAINGMEINEFWKVFGTQLKMVNQDLNTLSLAESKLMDKYDNGFLNMTVNQEKIDYSNYRILLWKTMTAFPEVAEAKTRDTSELLLSFIKDECSNLEMDYTKTWDIKSHSIETENNSKENVIKGSDQDKRKKQTQNIKNKERTISTILQVFAKIRSPKSMFRESELNQLYLDLLSYKNSDVQKLALDCLMTYRHEYLTVYKEQLYNLIDDKNFKNEISLFRISKDCSVVQEKHRQSLVPIILKIVFSKMTSKSGLRTGGKSFGQMRRNLVLRFLSGCQENEIEMFVHMSFRYYSKYLHGFSGIENISNECNLEKFVPLKRLQSSANLLLLILEELGGSLSNNLLQYLLKILMVMGALVKGVFSQISLVHMGYREILKKLRSSLLNVLEKFFDHFDKYPWTPEEIDVVFETFVWPYIKQLEIEGIHSPSALLRLFLQWGSRSRYFELLIKYYADDKDLTAMACIIKLLLNKSTHPSVRKVIMEMINYLLTFNKDNENEQETLQILVNNTLNLKNNLPHQTLDKHNLNLATYIVLPHVSSVLDIIKNKLQKNRKGLNTTELSVLSSISEFVWDTESSKIILDLMIPLLSRMPNLNDDNIFKFVITIDHLIQKIEQPQKYLTKLLPLFSDISYKPARKQLCKIFNKVSTKSTTMVLNTLAGIITELNACDDKWIDQPNFERRLEAFKQIHLLIESNNIEIELGLAIFYNCCYMLKYENDISLKEKSNHYWKTISHELLKKFDDKRLYLLDEHLFVTICEGFKNKNQEYRNECIQLLGYIARYCPDSHIVLKQLNKLTNETDLEVDFFENLTHLQIHRHVRALLKFVDVFTNKVDSDTNYNRTLVQFIFPLVSWYLCNEKYVSKNSLIDASIEAVKAICKILPWNQYGNLLKMYMHKLRYKTIFKKQLVRVIVAILDAFNFDLTNGYAKSVEETSFCKELEKRENEQVLEAKNEEEDIATEEEKPLEEMEMDENMHSMSIDVSSKTFILTAAAATKVIHTIQKMFLPQLFRLLAEYSHHDLSHKLNKKKTLSEKEEDDLQKIPISLALVKLLQKLPKVILDKNLPMIFMKLATFLKSHLESVRRIARETFEQIMCAVGPKYLKTFLEAIQPLLLRGFQVHVLVYTVHGVLASLKDMYQPGDIDEIIATVLNICKADLFGTVAEEKQIDKIRVKIREAKTTRSYETLQILALFVTEKYLMDLIVPLRSVLLNLRSFKNNRKMQECFRYIALGLVANKFIAHESLMKFSYGIISQNIPELFSTVTNKQEKQKTLLTERSDCFIIPPVIIDKYEAREMVARVSDNMNNYVLITFGLSICHNLIKKDLPSNISYKSFMDPFVKLFRECLNSQHIKLNTLALKCLIGIAKYDLPSFRENMKEISENIFKILHKFAVTGLNKGDNFDLVLTAFKFMAVVLREVKYYTIDKEQLRMLLFYVEQDLHDNDRQINALMLLKAIISRKFDLPEIYTVMNKVTKISITSTSLQVRNYACQVFLHFFINYPLGKKIDSYIGFYLSQISYEYQSGRQSALWMIQNFINSFPMKLLKAQSGSIMVTLSTQLINDDDPECRKNLVNCLTNMLKRLVKQDRDPLFDIIKLWLLDEKINHRQLAAQLCGIFVDVEKSTFESRIPALIPILLSQFNEKEKSFSVLLSKTDSLNSSFDQWTKDHYLFQLLQTLLKLYSHCSTTLRQMEEIEVFASYAQSLLSYPHEWVRLSSAQFLGFILSDINIEELADCIKCNKSNKRGGYLYSDPRISIKSLTLDLCALLQTDGEHQQLSEQVIKNLIFIARIFEKVQFNKEEEHFPDLFWLLKRMRRISNWELIHSPKRTSTRKAYFKWIAGVGTVLENDKVRLILPILLPPLIREMMGTDTVDNTLQQLSKEVANILKQRVGQDFYSVEVSKAKQKLSLKQAKRKRVNKQMAVADTELHAKKKLKRNLKKESKKKTLAIIRSKPLRKGTKRKLSIFEDD